MNYSPLSGLRVLDLTDEKGMLCSRLLAERGAETIKVEPPGGDPVRQNGPFLNDKPNPESSLLFWEYNASKRSITLNLESDEGRVLLRRLVEKADILVESFPPGHLQRLGLDYQSLSGLNRRLIMASITPFGQTGPRRDYKACDLTLSALGGQLYLNGEPDAPPLKLYGQQAYHLASLFALTGILIALFHRHASDRGQHIDVSIQECVAAALDHTMVRYFYQGTVPERQGSLHWSGGFRLFPCQDGHVLLSLNQDWEVLVEWLGTEGMANDLAEARWRDRKVRQENLGHIIAVLERWTKSHTAAELVEKGQLMRFPWAEVSDISGLVNNPHLQEREFFARVQTPSATSYLQPRSPYVERTPLPRRAPSIGEHNEAVYCGLLGLSAQDLAGLKAKGVI